MASAPKAKHAAHAQPTVKKFRIENGRTFRCQSVRLREEAAHIGGMDRQTLCAGFIASTLWAPDGRSKGSPSRLSPRQLATFAGVVETGPDRAKDGVVRWRRIDLILVATALKMANSWEKFVNLRAGKLRGAKGPGLFLIMPVNDNVVAIIDERIQTTAFSAERR